MPKVNALKQLTNDSYVNELVRIFVERQGRVVVADTRIAEKPANVSVLPPVTSIMQG